MMMASEGTAVTHRFPDRHPVASAAWVGLVGATIVGIVLVGMGRSLTDGLLLGPLGRWDESVNDWLLAQRTPPLNDIAHIGSLIATTQSIIVVAAACVAGFLVRRRFREAGLMVVALAVEASVFLVTTLVVARDRPTVPRLEPSPPTSSFPSGHTAAAIALYVSLALALTPLVHRRWVRVAIWALAIAIPAFVALSRVYAGMHHVTDVGGSLVLGVGALATAVVAVSWPRAEDHT